MPGFILWGHAATAALFAALTLWQLARRPGGRVRQAAAVALAATALWSVVILTGGVPTAASRTFETLRNLGWLALVATLFAGGAPSEDDRRRPMIVAIYGLMFGILVMQAAIDLLPLALDPVYAPDFVVPSRLLRMTFAVGALLLVHNLYSASAAETRWGIGPPMAALGLLWAYDLNLYTVAALIGRPPLLFALRGPFTALLSPLFAVAILRGAGFRVRLSRATTFRSLALLATGIYLAAMLAAAKLLELFHGRHELLAEMALPLAALVFAALLLPSRRLRAWARVKVAKHLFEHRYDYRVEWLRFTDTLGRQDADLPLEARAVKALADITDSPGGALLEPDAEGDLVLAARWNWATLDAPAPAVEANLAGHLATGWILEFDTARDRHRDLDAPIPAWLLAEHAAWAAVPLIHGQRLTGVALLARPRIDRSLDWEDFDLLKAAGRQVASYLAEARAGEALADGRRFEEFNRRFAFVAHDIKNLASQIGLVARNAERHADNPEFRADMIATLNASAEKMQGLLARLSLHSRARGEPPRAVDAGGIVRTLAAGARLRHPVLVTGAAGFAEADAARLEQAVGHLLQNAIEASAADAPVTLRLGDERDHVVVAVEDRGAGMTADFVRTQLFRPFASTKPDGFGVGAYEAKSLVEAMGGRLEVVSRPGEGTCFTIRLPRAETAPMPLKAVA